ncbi:MAG: 4Fe-4S dicluster domain-containing protein [bacterium]|nr:4Fe-4S dicluster domain-containing protein [bacterium]
MRIRPRHWRIASQSFFLLAFLVLLYGMDRSFVPGRVASILLSIDPLSAVGVALADWTVPHWTWIGFVVIVVTAILGRVFCGWLCPLGTLQQLVSWLSGPVKRQRRDRNRYRGWFSVKYMLLTVFSVWALLGVVQFGWLDPIPLLHRAFATGIRPLWLGVPSPGGWFAFSLLAAILLTSAWMPRVFCRAVCPLGAMLGIIARVAPFRLRRIESDCTDCNLCLMACQGGDEPLGNHRVSECHVCLNCLDSCAEDSLSYGLALPVVTSTNREPKIDISRRRMILGVAAAGVIAPVMKAASGSRSARAHDVIRPPGAIAEDAFLARCINCGACTASCPTGVIATDLGRSGVEGLFTPIMLMQTGWCEPSCIRCGEVCPTDAIKLLDPRAKQAIDGPAEVKVGTAFFDRGRCLPWAMDIPCIVCEEMCPTSPKAIRFEHVERIRPDGGRVALQQPWIEPDLCTGCGLCENRCPVGDQAAIRVSSVGETRDPNNHLLQGSTLQPPSARQPGP